MFKRFFMFGRKILLKCNAWSRILSQKLSFLLRKLSDSINTYTHIAYIHGNKTPNNTQASVFSQKEPNKKKKEKFFHEIYRAQ